MGTSYGFTITHRMTGKWSESYDMRRDERTRQLLAPLFELGKVWDNLDDSYRATPHGEIETPKDFE